MRWQRRRLVQARERRIVRLASPTRQRVGACELMPGREVQQKAVLTVVAIGAAAAASGYDSGTIADTFAGTGTDTEPDETTRNRYIARKTVVVGSNGQWQ